MTQPVTRWIEIKTMCGPRMIEAIVFGAFAAHETFFENESAAALWPGSWSVTRTLCGRRFPREFSMSEAINLALTANGAFGRKRWSPRLATDLGFLMNEEAPP